MSSTLKMMKYVKSLLINKTQVSADRIFIANPSIAFIGEGPILLIYQKQATRSPYQGDSNYHTSSRYIDTIAIDAVVDDLINGALNTDAVELMTTLQNEIELQLFGNRDVTIPELSDAMGFDENTEGLLGYAPGSATPYTIESDKGSMIGISTELTVQYVEEWQRIGKDVYLSNITGKIDHGDGDEWLFEGSLQ